MCSTWSQRINISYIEQKEKLEEFMQVGGVG